MTEIEAVKEIHDTDPPGSLSLYNKDVEVLSFQKGISFEESVSGLTHFPVESGFTGAVVDADIRMIVDYDHFPSGFKHFT